MAASWTPNASEGLPVRGSFEISTMSSLHYILIPFHVPVKLETVAASLSHLQTGERDWLAIPVASQWAQRQNQIWKFQHLPQQLDTQALEIWITSTVHP